MLFATVFGVSLLGLVTLFALKTLELTRNVRTPLFYLRSVCDPLISHGWTACKQTYRHVSVTTVRLATVWLRTTLHNTHLFFDALIHAFATRLNRYLRGRRTQVRQGTADVSVHLKSVLEKTEGDSSRPNSL